MADTRKLNLVTYEVADFYEKRLLELYETSPNFETFVSDTKDIIKADLWRQAPETGLIQTAVGNYIIQIDFWALCEHIEWLSSDDI